MKKELNRIGKERGNKESIPSHGLMIKKNIRGSTPRMAGEVTAGSKPEIWHGSVEWDTSG